VRSRRRVAQELVSLSKELLSDSRTRRAGDSLVDLVLDQRKLAMVVKYGISLEGEAHRLWKHVKATKTY